MVEKASKFYAYMIGMLAQTIRAEDSFKNVLIFFVKFDVSQNHVYCNLIGYLISIILPHYLSTQVSNRKRQSNQGKNRWCFVFLQTKLQQITVQENILCVFALARLTFGLCTAQTDNFHFTYHPFNGRVICTLDDFQRLRCENSPSPDKITGKPIIVSQPTSSKEIIIKINVYIFIENHLRDQWHSLIYP